MAGDVSERGLRRPPRQDLAAEVMSPEAIQAAFAAAQAGLSPEEAARAASAGGAAAPRPADLRRRRVRPMDFSRPRAVSAEGLRRIERVHEELAQQLSRRLGSELGTVCDLALLDIDQLSWPVAVERVPARSLSALLTTEPDDLPVVLTLELGFVQRALERTLGAGKSATLLPPPPPRPRGAELTDIELALTGHLVRALVTPLSAAWEELFGLGLAPGQLELRPDGLNLFGPGEVAVTITFEVLLEGVSTTLMVLCPGRSIEGRLESRRLVGRSGRGGGPGTEAANPAVLAQLAGVQVEVQVEAAELTMTLDELLALAPGDVVPLGVSAGTGVVLRLGPRVLHSGRAGTLQRKRAVEVTGPAGLG